ncbi:MAG TPA: isoquinoline 1-oxidoreductase [Sphingomonas bacterium]|jgi:isoquinoline 1-oxidoreductase alpha subunit|uniref:Isoquinoline 1-oxidoreductase n=1 Tax=Sphingomonas bacterium TaxID=1895847 RepID=A0A3D0WCL3_9SPHN|nr:isoquinoline 1-oxidoreductase [Sphingomonas bacterium]
MTRLTVNNAPIQYALSPETPLAVALRDASNLTGTKIACSNGECGACTVDIDGRAVRSCAVTIASVEGSFVTTIEGLARDRDHPVQQAFLAANVSQCGYCIPGLVMAAAVLIRDVRDPDEAAIRRAMSHHCRCGIHPRLVEAVRRAAAIERGDETVTPVASPDIDARDAAKDVPALAAPKRLPRS